MRLKGIILKGIGGFYYVEAGDRIYATRARGLFRNEKIKPLVGDQVEIDVTSDEDSEAYIQKILPRKSRLQRPEVANVDQVIVTMALTNPSPNFILLDKLLILGQYHGVRPVICLNKSDLVPPGVLEEVKRDYEATGFDVIFVSVPELTGIEDLKAVLRGKVNVFAGPSGVGKSSITNALKPGLALKVGEVSERIGRGRHTTRHTELIELPSGGFVLDTPGFSSLEILQIPKDTLKDYYPDFSEAARDCRYRDCSHINEPGCGVKEAVADRRISQNRYHGYQYIYEELKKQKERY
ncbi:MAG: hypothetical protein AVO33_02840 [delta proteobacterium ML8_F1]|nr:MAG: hypothetical protein AVO33_02840 [delta proteobacterium ML8_F1]